MAVLCAAIALSVFCYRRSDKPVANDGAVSLKAGNAAERLAFLSQFGWEVSEDPLEVTEVLIPAQTDEVFEKYNAIQKAQNLDLMLYSGQRVKQWTYAVMNYPGYEKQKDAVVVHLLVCDGLVIGGDVSSAIPDGFMHGFDFPTTPEPTT